MFPRYLTGIEKMYYAIRGYFYREEDVKNGVMINGQPYQFIVTSKPVENNIAHSVIAWPAKKEIM